MGIKVSKFIKKKINKSELKEIFKISNIIEEYLNQKEVNQRIQNSNVKGTDSQVIQKIIEEIAIPLGFKDEKQGLFKKYKDSGLRPDFYKKIGKNGILMEVERGKTQQITWIYWIFINIIFLKKLITYFCLFQLKSVTQKTYIKVFVKKLRIFFMRKITLILIVQ